MIVDTFFDMWNIMNIINILEAYSPQYYAMHAFYEA